jgi:hypothetical protein
MTSTAHTILVNVDTETAPKLVLYLANLLSVTENSDCEKLISESKTYELLSYMINQTDLILSSVPSASEANPMAGDKMIEGCYDAVVSILFTIQSASEFNDIVQLMVRKLTDNRSEKTALRLRILVNFYNLLVALEHKLSVLKGRTPNPPSLSHTHFSSPAAILQYSLVTNQTKLIAHFHPAVLKWITQWNISPSDQRDLYLSLSQVSQAEKSDLIAFEDLVKYFNTFSASETFPPEAVALATETILRSIKSSSISFSDRRILHSSLSKILPVIQDSSLLSLMELLRLLATGDIAGFTAFRSDATKAALLATHEVSVEHLLRSLKLLILCNLATTSNALSYDAIAAALEVPEEDVELWVVDAISHRLLEASLDQLHRMVVVK